MAICISGLDKFYGNFNALSNVNLNIDNGVFGLLGKNGAGKTTLMRILVTLVKPCSGNIVINDIPLIEKNYTSIKRIIGYMPQELGFYPGMTVQEFLSYIGIMQELPKKIYSQRIEQLLEQLNLTEKRNKKIKSLSGGMKRRVGLAQALINNPKILIVDEPTAGLDPEERIRLRNNLSNFAKDKIVILSTHIIEDIVAISKDIAILNKGKVSYNGNISNITNIVKDKIYISKLSNESELIDLSSKYTIITTSYVENGIDVKFFSDDNLSNCSSLNCKMVNATLEDAFIYMINRKEF